MLKGSSKFTIRLSVRMSEAENARLTEWAQKREMSVCAAIRQMIYLKLDADDAKAKEQPNG